MTTVVTVADVRIKVILDEEASKPGFSPVKKYEGEVTFVLSFSEEIQPQKIRLTVTVSPEVSRRGTKAVIEAARSILASRMEQVKMDLPFFQEQLG